jgi:hypothetical protein
LNDISEFERNILDKKWLDLQFHENKSDEPGMELIKKPNELENEMEDPPGEIDEALLDRIQGSIVGMALGDSLGAQVEFRPHEYMVEDPVTDLEGGGTWGLEKGQVISIDLKIFSNKKFYYLVY